jgi:polar amino acid transport system substrate-binding protein
MMKKPWWQIVVYGMLVVSLLGRSVNAQEQTLVLPCPPGLPRQLFCLVMQECGTRLGFDVKEKPGLSGQRALQEANDGITDGDGPRTTGLRETYPNLVQIPEPIVILEWVAFAKDSTITLDNWADLKPYRVGRILGGKAFEQHVKEAKTVHEVKDVEVLFKMLASDRIDLALLNKLDGLSYLKTHNLKEIQPLAPPLATTELFVYLHKKHADLVPKIAEALQVIKADGTYQKLIDQVLKQ